MVGTLDSPTISIFTGGDGQKARSAGFRILQVETTHYRRRSGGGRRRTYEIVRTMAEVVGLRRELQRS